MVMERLRIGDPWCPGWLVGRKNEMFLAFGDTKCVSGVSVGLSKVDGKRRFEVATQVAAERRTHRVQIRRKFSHFGNGQKYIFKIIKVTEDGAWFETKVVKPRPERKERTSRPLRRMIAVLE
jgi:hypothetical protein